MYDDDRRLLVLPLTLYSEAEGRPTATTTPSLWTPSATSGGPPALADTDGRRTVMLWRSAAVWRVGDATFELRGAIAHYSATAAAADARVLRR